MFFSSKKKNPHDTACMVCHVIVAFLLFLVSCASLAGVVMAHVDTRMQTVVFGTNAGSLSLLTFAIALTLWMKSMKYCMSACEVCGVNGKK